MSSNVNGQEQGQIQVSHSASSPGVNGRSEGSDAGCDDFRAPDAPLTALYAEDHRLRVELGRLAARIATRLGQPARARFERICAGDEQGDVHEAYIALRVEEFRNNGGKHYTHESPEDRATIEALASAADFLVGEVTP